MARVWNVSTRALVGTSESHRAAVEAVRFSQDGGRVLSSSFSTSLMWDPRTGTSIGRLRYLGAAVVPRFSTRGSEVVVTSTTATPSLWDVRGEPEWRGALSKDGVRSAAFSADGRLVTASEDGTIQFWNPRTQEKVGLALHHQGAAISAIFSGDGSRLLTLADDGVARIWDVPVGRPEDVPLLGEIADLISGHRVESASAVDHVEDRMNRLALMREAALRDPAPDSTGASFRRWLFGDPATRTVSPLSRITVPEYVSRLVAEGASGRREVERLFPGRQMPAGSEAAAQRAVDRPLVPIMAIARGESPW
jgi:hypothetical protein